MGVGLAGRRLMPREDTPVHSGVVSLPLLSFHLLLCCLLCFHLIMYLGMIVILKKYICFSSVLTLNPHVSLDGFDVVLGTKGAS